MSSKSNGQGAPDQHGELDSIIHLLDEIGRQERSDLQRAQGPSRAAPGRAEQALRSAIASSQTRPSRSRRWGNWLPVLLAAAATIVAVWNWPRENSSSLETTLGESLEIVGPIGTVDGYGTFEVVLDELPKPGFIEIRVFDADRPDDFDPVTSVRIEELTWTPVETLPRRIRWTADAFAGSSMPTLLSGDEAFAELRP